MHDIIELNTYKQLIRLSLSRFIYRCLTSCMPIDDSIGISIDDSVGISIDDSIGISIDTPVETSTDYLIRISINAFGQA